MRIALFLLLVPLCLKIALSSGVVEAEIHRYTEDECSEVRKMEVRFANVIDEMRHTHPVVCEDSLVTCLVKQRQKESLLRTRIEEFTSDEHNSVSKGMDVSCGTKMETLDKMWVLLAEALMDLERNYIPPSIQPKE